MKKQLQKIKQNLYWIIWGIVTLALVSFTTNKQEKRVCNKIHIHIENQLENYFIEQDDVYTLITQENRKPIVGLSRRLINLKQYEELLNKNSFVLKSAVSLAHTGDLYVYVKENKPVVRVFQSGRTYYLDETGKKLPLSDNFTSRSLVLRSNFHETFADSFYIEKGQKYMQIINFLNNHELWKKQIAEIEIDRKGSVFLYPQVGKQIISFGQPEDIETKFMKMEIFYKKILPSVGWNSYNFVKLEFKDQIVCE